MLAYPTCNLKATSLGFVANMQIHTSHPWLHTPKIQPPKNIMNNE